MTFASIILALVSLQRLSELVLARINTKELLAHGAVEIGTGHYPWMVAMHGAWLTSLWIWGWQQPVDLFGLGVFVMLQFFRCWVLATLGPRWTTRIIVLPGAPLVTNGPYRFMSHPNYAVVACEIAVLPFALGLPALAIIFSGLNAIILAVRIRVENPALSAQHAAA